MKTTIITGASDGIGRELALALSVPGRQLAVAARSQEKLDALVVECENRGAKCLAVRTDVSDSSQCQALIERTVRTFGGVDALVNNAGISMQARFEDVCDFGLYERLMRVNLYGAMYCTFHALPHLKKSRGIVAAVSSLQGKTGFPTYSAYAATKHAMQGFFDSLRIELVDSGVAVLVVSPGAVATEIHTRRVGADGAVLPTKRRTAKRGVMAAAECARRIVRALERRDRELVMINPLALWVRLLAPSQLDKIVARNVARFAEEERRDA